MDPAAARAELVRLLEFPPAPFPLDRAALLLAVDEYPDLPLETYEEKLEEFSARVSALLAPGELEPKCHLKALRQVLFEEEGFQGNREEYYDVRNSYLNEVLDRKLGIPISLGTVMVGVARRLNWPVVCINFPNHFLLGYAATDGLLPIDPFHGGLILDDDELCERWRQVTQYRPTNVRAQLHPADPRSVLVRMLNNIRLVHAQKREYRKAVIATEKVVLIEPGNPMHERDLGYFLLGARQVDEAVHHLRNYLTRTPQAIDADSVQEHLDNLQRLLERDEL